MNSTIILHLEDGTRHLVAWERADKLLDALKKGVRWFYFIHHCEQYMYAVDLNRVVRITTEKDR